MGHDAPAGEVRPRYGRIVALGLSVLVTATSVLGGLGVLPGVVPASATERPQDDRTSGAQVAREPTDPAAEHGVTASLVVGELSATEAADRLQAPAPGELAVPDDSGEGRRVVFDEGAQRVWLVKADGSVARSYLVSGSVYDNLDPGTYAVFSKDRHAWGIDGSQLRYMVRFTTGAEAAIGFHDIPVLDGEKVQSRAELGTPLSHGCVRQSGRDAKALWDFAPLGTTVVVLDSAADGAAQSVED